MTKKVAEVAEPTVPIVPVWFTEGIKNSFKAGIASVFLLHGDVTCLVPNPLVDKEPRYPYIPLIELFARLFDKREMVIFYNVANGMRFLTPEMEKRFRKEAELVAEDDAASANPVAAAKAGLAAKRKLPTEPEACLPLMEKVLGKMDKVALVIEAVHNIAPEQAGAGALQAAERTNIARLRTWAQDARVKKRSNIVLLLTDLAAKVSGELRQVASRIPSIFIPKPTSSERKLYIIRQTKGTPEKQELDKEINQLRRKLARTKGRDVIDIQEEISEMEENLKRFGPHFEVPKDFDIDAFVNATQGMSLRQILEIFRMANQVGQPIDLTFVKEKKREILNAEYGDVMEVVDPQWGLKDIGGLEKPKAYFARVQEAIRKGELRHVPQGITLMGPPGTGKTALVEGLAKGASYNFVKMKNVRSMWVGESEARVERQIQGLWALAPVIVMNDESDLSDADRDAPKGDSGVSERIMQARMQFLSDPRIRGRVIIVNCTNRPDRMDAAMKRSGRSDERIPILMPTEAQRSDIFAKMFRRYNISCSITNFSQFAIQTKDISGADIENIVLRSSRFASEAGKEKVDNQTLSDAIEDFILPASQADIDLMTLYAISESSSRRLLPDNLVEIVEAIRTRNIAPGCSSLIAQIEARGILPKVLVQSSQVV